MPNKNNIEFNKKTEIFQKYSTLRDASFTPDKYAVTRKSQNQTIEKNKLFNTPKNYIC